MVSRFKIKRWFSIGGIGKRSRESKRWDSLYRTIGYRFSDESLLQDAMTHSSFCRDDENAHCSNERLEFLGDAVLGLVVTDMLFHRFPESSEGELTRIKSHLVSRHVLGKHAENIGLGEYLLLGNGEERSGGRSRRSILSNALEALLGAMFLDGGLDAVKGLVRGILLKDADRLITRKFHQNYKSWLLEYVQAGGHPGPRYVVVKEEGPDHQKEFVVSVQVDGKRLGTGKGSSKKQAEQEAARQAIERLGLNLNEASAG